MPQAAVAQITVKFNRSGQRMMNDRLAALAKELGDEAAVRLREAVRMGSGPDAAEATGLLSRIDPAAVEEWLPQRIQEWPLAAQDRAVRVIAAAGAPERGELLLTLYSNFDPLVRPITLDEMGMCGDTSLSARIEQLLQSEDGGASSEYVRVKAIEALGRLHDAGARPVLQKFLEERRAWRWAYHDEVRISALQAIAKLDPEWAADFQPRAGLDPWQLSLAPLDASIDTLWHRQRRYQRLRLLEPVSAAITNLAEPARLAVKGLSLSGGTAATDRHILPGTHVALKIGLGGMRSIRAQALIRDVRGESLGFEFVSIDLEDRSRLRRFLFGQIRPDASPCSGTDGRA
jgi:HEAT repeat protein